ncbi:MAG: copper-containing nitrite reductase [Candidatus Sulfotelmatobacter sp.]
MSSTKNPAPTVDIVRDPADVPNPIGGRAPTTVHVTLTAEEVMGQLDPASGTTYRYWTFNGKVPGPMIRVRQGDMVEVTLRNDARSRMVHSVDFHAALGPGGGAAFSQAIPGQAKTFTFQATTPGLFLYHCGTPMIAEHIANGMYGLILVEPSGGLSRVDHEYYFMQGEIYTTAAKGKAGLQQFSDAKLLDEDPEYFVFNGAVDALSKRYPLRANEGETVRLFFGDAGPNETSSLHVVGEIFTRDYVQGSLTSPALSGIQTAAVPPGSAAILELTASVPGQFSVMDHAMARMAKGLLAILEVTGAENATLMHAGPALRNESSQASTAWVTGMTQSDGAANIENNPGSAGAAPASSISTIEKQQGSSQEMAGMAMEMAAETTKHTGHAQSGSALPAIGPAASNVIQLNGCLTLLEDGRVMLHVLPSARTYRMEARPLLFSQNANRLVHVTGRFGSVVAVEDPRIPSFVVDKLDELAPNCSVKITPAMLRKVAEKEAALTIAAQATVAGKGTVNMGDMSFLPATITVNAGERVVWKNSSFAVHNVVDDANKATSVIDVKLPAGVQPFDSGCLQPGQIYSRVFTVPGVYRYVCTLHEANGMKGVVIVRPSAVLAARK